MSSHSNEKESGSLSSKKLQQPRHGNEKMKMKALPEKKFEVRESLLTDLFGNPHIKTVKNIFSASLVMLFINTVAHDYFRNGEIKVGFGVISDGFGKLHVVAAIWIILNIFAILCYFCFNLWAIVRINLPPKSQNVKLWDTIFMLALPAYYVMQFRIISMAVKYFEIPIASSAVLCLEQVRFLMKIHAFVRSNISKMINFKAHSDSSLELAPLSHFGYFLYAPTIIYRDSYPRSKRIRWNFILERCIEIVGVIFYYAFLMERFVIPAYKNIGLTPFTWSDLLLSILENGAVGLLFLLVGFYVILHSTQNLVGELLRFGDKLFYQDWWTSTSYKNYFRTWNIVVSDWLYTYIYKDFYEIFVPGNKTVAKLAVFAISAVVHEWVLTYMFGFFFPALFLMFFFSGSVLSFLNTPKMDLVNVLFWYGLAFGSASLVSLYSAEYFVRKNMPIENPTFRDFIVPRLFTCKCIV